MRNLPNLITSVRLIAALTLLALSFAFPTSAVRFFLPLFIAGGISDMLDGFIARRFGWCTEFGAKLDSISDLTLYASVASFLAFNMSSILSSSCDLILLGFAVQLLHLIFAYAKFSQFPAYHSDYTRLCAYLIFFGVNALWIFKTAIIFTAIVSLWITCSIEGLLISLLLSELRSNVRGISEVISMELSLH